MAPSDILGDHVGSPGEITAVENFQQRLVRTAGAGVRFLCEALAQRLLAEQILTQHVNQHCALEPVVVGAVDHGQAACAEFFLDPVAPSEDWCCCWRCLCHGRKTLDLLKKIHTERGGLAVCCVKL